MTTSEQLKSFSEEFKNTSSPFTRWLNPVIVAAEEGHLKFEYTVRNEWLNPMNILHGGITSAIIDDTLGATALSLNESVFYTTINNVIDYFSTAKEGDKIIAETKIIKRGKQFINAQCEIWNIEKNRLIARGTSNLFKTEINKK